MVLSRTINNQYFIKLPTVYKCNNKFGDCSKVCPNLSYNLLTVTEKLTIDFN